MDWIHAYQQQEYKARMEQVNEYFAATRNQSAPSPRKLSA